LRKLWKKNEGWDPERTAELTEHLAELRTRIIRACAYALLGMVVMYFLYKPVYALLSAPLIGDLNRLKSHSPATGQVPSGVYYNSFTDAFFQMLQVVTVGGLVLAMPFIIGELWGFISPALTTSEKRGVYFVAPMSVVLFVLGVLCAYMVLPMAVRWFLSFIPPGFALLQNPLPFIVFAVKMLLAFGLVFQLPVLLMFLGKIGILTSAIMVRYWRQIAVGLFTVAMVVAPSNDPGTMLALAVPLTILFFGSIGLVKMVEPKTQLVENAARLTASAGQKALEKTWDTPEEDAAWRDL
jgi:sec-independent protein translocase protein TatC